MGAFYSNLAEAATDTEGFPFTATTTLTGGDLKMEQNKVGLIRNDTDSGDTAMLMTSIGPPGVDVPRQTTDSAWTAGQSVYYDTTNTNVSTDSGNGTLCGYAYTSATDTASTGRVVLTDEQL